MKSALEPDFILVLCEGNHGRSPMAEGLLRAELGPAFRIESAGLAAKEGYAPHPEAIRLMAERDIDITRLRSRQVTPGLALAADLILVMDRVQQAWCESLAVSVKGRVYLLGHWLPPDQQEIKDPVGAPPEAFALAFTRILQSVQAWRSHLTTLRRQA